MLYPNRPCWHILSAAALLVVISWLVVAASHGAGQPGAKKEGEAQPLRLDILVMLDKMPATLLFRATNASKEPVTVERFDHPTNHAVVITPGGKEVPCILYADGFGREGPKTSIALRPGESKEWEMPVGNPMVYSVFAEAGTYRIRWKLNKQMSEDVLLYRKDAAFREAEEKGR